jgi:hypothetical protein
LESCHTSLSTAGTSTKNPGAASFRRGSGQQVEKLSPEELEKFRAWFAEFDARLWDAQIDADAKAGELDGLVAEALGEHKAGKTREL